MLYRRLQGGVPPDRPLQVIGLRGAAPAFWIAAEVGTKPLWIIVPDPEAARRWHSDLSLVAPDPSLLALLLPAEGPPAIQLARQLEQAYYLTRWLSGEALCLITPVHLLRQRWPTPAIWRQHLFSLQPGMGLDKDFLLEILRLYHFVEREQVENPGEFAWRGAVVDVFSFAYPYPLRLRLDAEGLRRIHYFDPETQLSKGELPEAWLLPPLSALEETPSASLEAFAPEATQIFLIEGQAALAYLTRMKEDTTTLQHLAQRAIELGHEPAVPPAATFAYPTQAQPSFPHNLNLFYEHLRGLPLRTLYVYVENERQKSRLERLFRQAELPYPVEYRLGTLSEGFYDPQAEVAFYTDHQIFRRVYTPPVHRGFRRSEALALRDLEELQIGDYVVHERYGIALFGGLVTIPRTDPPQEGVKLIFADEAVVYVPIPQLAEIARYRSLSDAPPKLSKLGSSEWQRTKERVRRRLQELAIDLVRLYAKRRILPGYAFSPDSLLQVEMESRFPYEETPDQLQATLEVKRDMEQPYPMDRLLCGDVGFGKTEVALRAAFKAVQDGKQVALLAPTTVLVMQHLRTFEARLEGFPVRLAALSRVQSPRQQKTILERLAAGEIDIIIGTHRLLSPDVRFKDLGLLIIDEEHKFGVVAKEKLRVAYPTVDTLSMSATPIPRTLQMALSGIRDISLITTPPKNRLPVETKVQAFSWEVVQEAIQHELARGGQVFYVHNRIPDLPAITRKLQSLFPEAQVAFIHAQMPARQVEDILLAFIYQQVDILVTTNLVESGLDIPNANTIIVQEAHRFGLSDLHQLRGRVGRGARQAYCYFLVPGLHFLSPDALRRLRALEEFSDLGSGFQIAMRDLEIRGAGDLLGREQSGFIADIGYELYQRYLEEAIARIKEEENLEGLAPPEVPLAQCVVECDWDARLPSEWIPYPATRLEVYRRLSAVRQEAELQAFLRELLDRFGSLPPAVLTLADILRLRWLGDSLGLPYIQVHRGRVRLPFPSETPPAALLAFLDSYRPKLTFRFIPQEPHLLLEVERISDSASLVGFLESLREVLRHPSLTP
ncbi:MAG: transcription-repair coupling factor [Bacteroidia bacterium]